MAEVRPLRELLADLVGDPSARAGGPSAYLAEHGHADLPADLVAEAVVSYADTAPPEVAEQLAPFVTAHTAGDEEPADWFDLLTSASADLPDDLDALDSAPAPWTGDDFDADPGPVLDFGTGATDSDAPVADDDVDESFEAETSADWPSTEQSQSDAAAVDPEAMDVAAAEALDDDTDDDPDPDALD
jgi:hypothetical protein